MLRETPALRRDKFPRPVLNRRGRMPLHDDDTWHASACEKETKRQDVKLPPSMSTDVLVVHAKLRDLTEHGRLWERTRRPVKQSVTQALRDGVTVNLATPRSMQYEGGVL
jgi:hypothetical protein